MAPRSRRGKILLNLQKQLETITTGNGYTNNIYKVTTDTRNWSDTPEPETPVIYIVDESTGYTYHAGKTTEREWNIALYGVMKNKSQIEMEEFIADVEECLMKNVTLAFDGVGVVSHSRITDIVTDGQFFSEIEGTQLFRVGVVLRYIACVDDIR